MNDLIRMARRQIELLIFDDDDLIGKVSCLKANIGTRLISTLLHSHWNYSLTHAIAHISLSSSFFALSFTIASEVVMAVLT